MMLRPAEDLSAKGTVTVWLPWKLCVSTIMLVFCVFQTASVPLSVSDQGSDSPCTSPSTSPIPTNNLDSGIEVCDVRSQVFSRVCFVSYPNFGLGLDSA